MELCRESDIFIGRTNEFERYSGLLDQPVIPEAHKGVKCTRRRVTLNSFQSKNKNTSFNNDLTSCQDKKRVETSVKMEYNETPSSSRYENDHLAAGDKKASDKPVVKNKKYTRNKRRSRRDSFGLNCTFIEDEEGKQSAKLDHQKLLHSGRYSLRSSFGINDSALLKNYDFVTVRKMNQQRSVEEDKENTNSPMEDRKNYSSFQVNEKKGGKQRKYFSSNCAFTSDTEENLSPEVRQQKSLYTDFVAVRKVDKASGTFPIEDEKKIEDSYLELEVDKKNHELQFTNSTLSTKDEKNINSSVKKTKELHKGKDRRRTLGSNYNLQKNTQISPELEDRRFYTKKGANQRKTVDMKRPFIKDTDDNELYKFQLNQQLFNSNNRYSLRSSLGAFQHNLKINDLAKIDQKSDFLPNEPTENVKGRVGEKNQEIYSILQADKTLKAKTYEFHNNIALPEIEEDNTPVHIYQESDDIILSSTFPLCGKKYISSNRFLEETEKTSAQSCESDIGSSSFSIDPFDNNIMNNEKGFVRDKETNECNDMFLLNNAKKINNIDEEIEVSLSTQKLEDCILPLNMKTRKSINKDDFSRADIKESKIRNKPEIILKENFNESCLVENWITSHFHCDSKKQFFRICNSLNSSGPKTSDLNRAFPQFTSQDEKNFPKSITVESFNQQSSESDIPLLESSSKRGGRKKDDGSEKKKKSNKKETTKKSSNLETIFENPERQLMSSRRFKRSINFDNFSSFARVRRRKLKAKKINSFQSRDIVDTSKLDEILDKLSLSD